MDIFSEYCVAQNIVELLAISEIIWSIALIFDYVDHIR